MGQEKNLKIKDKKVWVKMFTDQWNRTTCESVCFALEEPSMQEVRNNNQVDRMTWLA